MLYFLIIVMNFLLSSESTIDSILISTQDQDKRNFLTSSYKLESFLSSNFGGNTEGLSTIWIDLYINSRNINLMNYDDIMSLPNVTPLDANAIIMQKERGVIDGDFQLKNSPGISYYGYKSILPFVVFNNTETNKLNLRFSSLIRTTPVVTNPDSEQENDFFYSQRPEQFHKISTHYIFGKNQSTLKLGVSYRQLMGQSDDIYTNKRFLEIKDIPILKNKFNIDEIVLGNFTASFGQGVTFESTDHFSPRKTGYGFSKRNVGISSDITSTTQYILNGSAFQVSNKFLRFSYFRSKSPRDAIINSDSESFSSLIVMQPRLSWGYNNNQEKIYSDIVSSVIERTMGWNLRLGKGSSYVGFTFYRSLYDKYLIPEPIETIIGGADDVNPEYDVSDFDDYSGDAFYQHYVTNSADPEIAAMYHSSPEFIKSNWVDAKSYRKVMGLNFSTTIKNIVFQGEFAQMPKYSCLGVTNQDKENKTFISIVSNQASCLSDSVLTIGNFPKAMVVSAYTNFDNINFFLLYRNYDLDFDNPYQRSFSNYQRYKTTIFEDVYWLEDPVYGFLHSGNPQPQAEEGIYFSSRHQVHRSLLLKYEIDGWNRKADNTKYYRTVINIEWRPVFNYRIYLRQKWSGRGQFNVSHASPFDSRETRIRFKLRLSNFNSIELLVTRGYTTFSPRPRLTDNPIASDMLVGDISVPNYSLGFMLTHNLDDKISIKAGTLFLNGFMWYIEDNDFRILESVSGAVHNWMSIRYRPTQHISVNLKYALTDHFSTTTITQAESEAGYLINNPLIKNMHSDYKIQVDYVF